MHVFMLFQAAVSKNQRLRGQNRPADLLHRLWSDGGTHPREGHGEIGCSCCVVVDQTDGSTVSEDRSSSDPTPDGPPTPDALKRYKDLYKEELPLHFIEAVTALVKATTVGKTKLPASGMAAEGVAQAT